MQTEAVRRVIAAPSPATSQVDTWWRPANKSCVHWKLLLGSLLTNYLAGDPNFDKCAKFRVTSTIMTRAGATFIQRNHENFYPGISANKDNQSFK